MDKTTAESNLYIQSSIMIPWTDYIEISQPAIGLSVHANNVQASVRVH